MTVLKMNIEGHVRQPRARIKCQLFALKLITFRYLKKLQDVFLFFSIIKPLLKHYLRSEKQKNDYCFNDIFSDFIFSLGDGDISVK